MRRHSILIRSFTFSLLATLVLSVAGTLYAQNLWTLEDCINYALDNNIQVKQKQLDIELQEEYLLTSKLDMLPDLNGYVSHGYNWGKSVDRFTNEFATERVRSNNLYASSNFTIFNGFRKLNTMKQSKLYLLATNYESDKFMDDISLNIVTYYLTILYNTENLKIAQSQLDITTQQVSRTQKLVEAGTLARGDLLTVEAQAATEELNVITAMNNLELAYLDLSQALDLPTPEGFEIEIPVVRITEQIGLLPNPESVYNYALISRPEIKGAETRLEASEKGISIAKGGMSPNLYLSGSWGSGYSGANKVGEDETTTYPIIGYTEGTNPIPVISAYPSITYADYKVKGFGDQLKDNNNRSFMIHLNIPIFNGWQTNSAIQQAKISQQNAYYNLELEKLNLNKIINQAYADASAAYKKYISSIKNVDATTEAFKYAEQKFNVGLITSLEYNESKKENTLAQSLLISAKYEYLYTVTILDFYMGNPISIDKFRAN